MSPAIAQDGSGFIPFNHRPPSCKGTRDCVKQSLAAGLDVFLFDNEHGNPKRIKADDERFG
jgi:hypothetical protein